MRSVGLLNVPYSTFAGASVARLVRSALSALRDKNLCIIRASMYREWIPRIGDTDVVQEVGPLNQGVKRDLARIMH